MKKICTIWILVLILLTLGINAGSDNFTIEFDSDNWQEDNNGLSTVYDSALIVSGSSYNSGVPSGTTSKNTLVYSEKNFNNSYSLWLNWTFSFSCYVDADTNNGQNSNANAGIYITDGENKTALITDSLSCSYTGSSATVTKNGGDLYRFEINKTNNNVKVYNRTGGLVNNVSVTLSTWYLGASYASASATGVSGEFAYASVNSQIKSLNYEVNYPSMFFNEYTPFNNTFIVGDQNLTYSTYNMGTTDCTIDTNSINRYNLTGLSNGEKSFAFDSDWMTTFADIDLVCNDSVNTFSQTKHLNNGLSVNITFKDEITDTIITTLNVSVELISPSTIYNFTTDNGSIEFNIVQDDYKVFYSAPGYPVRERDLFITGDTENNLVLYLANYTTTIELKSIVMDQFTNRVPSARLEIQKKFTSDNTFKTILDLSTNVNGEAFVDLVPETDLYRYLIYYQGELVWNKSDVNGEILSSSQTDAFIFNVFLGEDVYELGRLLGGVTATFNNSNSGDGNVSVVAGTFQASFVSTTSQQYCMRVVKIYNVFKEEVYDECITGTSGTFSTPFTTQDTSLYFAGVYLVYNDERYTIATSSETFELTVPSPYITNDSMRYEGWFFSFLILVGAMLIGHKAPIIIPLLVDLAFIVLVKTNLILVNSNNKGLMITIATIVAFWIMYIMNKE